MAKLSVPCSLFADEKTEALIWQQNSCHSYMASKYWNAGLLTCSWRVNASKEPGHCHLHSQGAALGNSTCSLNTSGMNTWGTNFIFPYYSKVQISKVEFWSLIHLTAYTACVVNYTYLFPLVSSPFDPTVYANGPIFLLIPQWLVQGLDCAYEDNSVEVSAMSLRISGKIAETKWLSKSLT